MRWKVFPVLCFSIALHLNMLLYHVLRKQLVVMHLSLNLISITFENEENWCALKHDNERNVEYREATDVTDPYKNAEDLYENVFEWYINDGTYEPSQYIYH